MGHAVIHVDGAVSRLGGDYGVTFPRWKKHGKSGVGKAAKQGAAAAEATATPPLLSGGRRGESRIGPLKLY